MATGAEVVGELAPLTWVGNPGLGDCRTRCDRRHRADYQPFFQVDPHHLPLSLPLISHELTSNTILKQALR